MKDILNILRNVGQVERVDPTTSVAKALKRKYGPSSWDGQVPWERGSMKLVDVEKAEIF